MDEGREPKASAVRRRWPELQCARGNGAQADGADQWVDQGSTRARPARKAAQGWRRHQSQTPSGVSTEEAVVGSVEGPARIEQGSAKPAVVLVHGLWMTPRSWEHWVARFERRGYHVL